MAQSAKSKLTIIGVIAVVIVIALVVWNQKNAKQGTASGNSDTKELVIGISPPFANPLKVAIKEAAEQGIRVKLVEFSDWNTPNITLNHGDIDANYFQHQPFLSNALKETDFKLTPIGIGAATHVGLYSNKFKNLSDIPEQAHVVIPNDPVNQGRALLLLQQAQFVTLKDPKNHLSKLSDIVENPKKLKFTEVEGPQTARAVDEADLVFSYPHYLKLAGTKDPNDALVFDDNTNTQYAILFVVREDYASKFPERAEQLKKFINIYQTSPAVLQALNDEVGEKLWFPGWK